MTNVSLQDLTLFVLSGAPNNTAGRITKVISRTTTNTNGQTFQDSEERHYGKLGEVVYEKKTVVTFTSPNTPSVFETKYQFDTFGRLQKLTYPDGEVLTNAYDSGGNLLATKGEKNGYRYDYLKALRYDEFEQRVMLEAGNNVKTAYTYNAQTRRLSSLTAGKGGGNLFQNLQYTYDNVGNILNLKNQVDVPPASSYGGPTNQTFVYDELYRLTHADGTFQYSPNKTHTYNLDMGYDSIHNIQTKNQLHTLVQPSTQAITQKKTTYNWSYQYNASGPSSVRPHAPNHIGDRTFTYDANGNQTGWTHDQNGTKRTILWNEENRAEEIADNGHVKTYKYDDQGNRTIKRGPQGETVYVNQFYTQRPGATGTKHVYAGTSRIVSKLMKQDVPGANPQGKTPFEKDLYFYHPDHLGTSNYITDTNGKLYEHLEYFPFGEGWVEENSNTQRTPYLFTAKELDEETGLYYFGARYYDPRTSVWQSADPILGKYLSDVAGVGMLDPINLNLYRYARLNPLKIIDPDGREDCDESCQRNRDFGTESRVARAAETVKEGMSTTGDVIEKGYEIQAGGGAAKIAVAGVLKGGGKAWGWIKGIFGRGAPKAEGSAANAAHSATSAVRLKNQLAAQEIAGGHAFKKHVVERGEFAGIARTQEQFAAHIENVMTNPTAVRQLSNGRTGYWHQETGTVVVRNPAARDGGTAFQPELGRTYFDDVLK